jgi:hypothetical protein
VTQILAVLLGVRKLERVASHHSGFNSRLVIKAERLHKRAPIFKDGYEGEKQKIREAVKDAWMTRNYGAKPSTIVRKQSKEPWRFGAGWIDQKAVTRFLHSLPWHQGIAAYEAACRRIAKVAYDKDPCAGVTLVDPFDQIPIRWNPVGVYDGVVQAAGGKFVIDQPGQWVKRVEGVSYGYKSRFNKQGDVWVNTAPNAAGDYPVDPRALGRKLAPYIVHTLDSFFCSLVIEGLAKRGVKDFVAIHDCWLVPATVDRRPGLDILYEVIAEASVTWFYGLGPIYDLMDSHLAGDTNRKGLPSKYQGFAKGIRTRWEDRKRRIHEGTDTPPCFVAAPH